MLHHHQASSRVYASEPNPSPGTCPFFLPICFGCLIFSIKMQVYFQLRCNIFYQEAIFSIAFDLGCLYDLLAGASEHHTTEKFCCPELSLISKASVFPPREIQRCFPIGIFRDAARKWFARQSPAKWMLHLKHKFVFPCFTADKFWCQEIFLA